MMLSLLRLPPLPFVADLKFGLNDDAVGIVVHGDDDNDDDDDDDDNAHNDDYDETGLKSGSRIRGRLAIAIDEQLEHLYDEYLTLLSAPTSALSASSSSAATSGVDANVPHDELVHGLLRGVRDVAQRYPHTQRRWSEAGAFSKILTLLVNVSPHTPPPAVDALCVSVLLAVAALVADNITAKRHVRDMIGYDSLHDAVLLCAVQPPPPPPPAAAAAASSSSSSVEPTADKPLLSSNVLDALFDLLVDGRFSLARRIRIANIDALDMMLRLSSRLAVADQQRLYATLVTVLDASPANRSLCCDHHVIYRLLEVTTVLL
jgi:hypothetical protein